MKGLSERLDFELNKRLNSVYFCEDNEIQSFKPKLYSSEPLYSPYNAWTGGSIIVREKCRTERQSSLGSFQQLWISHEEYVENGVEIISSRCN